METKLRYRTSLKRVYAALIDVLVFMPLVLVNYFVFQSWSNSYTENLLKTIWTIFFLLLPIAYSILCHYKYGQTVGKKIVNIKVLDISESYGITFRQAVLRDSVILLLTLWQIFDVLHNFSFFPEGQFIINYQGEYSEDLFLFWTLIELLSMLFNLKRRAVHDLISKSVVVRL